jgi:hypothetical protein
MGAKISFSSLKEICDSFIALNPKSRRSILSYMLIEAHQEYISFKATDLDNFVFASLPCQSTRHFSIMVDIKEFVQLLKNLKKETNDIEIDVINNDEVAIRYNDKEYVLLGNTNIEHFPNFPMHTFTNVNFRLKSNYLDLMNNLFDAVIDKEIEPATFRLVHYKTIADGIKFEAMNRYTLADLTLLQPIRFTDDDNNYHLYGNLDLIIFNKPEKNDALFYPSLLKIGAKLFKNDDYIFFYLSDKYMLLSNGKRFDKIRYIIVRLADDYYPNTDTIQTNLSLGTIFFNKDALLKTIANFKKQNSIVLKIKSNQALVSSVKIANDKENFISLSNSIPCEAIGCEFNISTKLTFKQLGAFLKIVNDKIIKFEFFARNERSGTLIVSKSKKTNESIRLVSTYIPLKTQESI